MRDCSYEAISRGFEPNPEPQTYGAAGNWRSKHEIISKQRELAGTEKCRMRLSEVVTSSEELGHG